MAGVTTSQRGDRTPPSARRPPSGDRGRLRPPARRAVLAALVALCLLGGGVWYLFYGSPWLTVRRVHVHGTRVLTAGQVEAAAGVPMGASLASVDTGTVAARLRAALPRIASVDGGPVLAGHGRT